MAFDSGVGLAWVLATVPGGCAPERRNTACSVRSLVSGVRADPLARRLTLEAITALAEAQVKTYVVGFQTADTSFADQLDQMAALGGTGELRHRSVENGSGLANTFQEIANRAASCSYRLEVPVANPSYVLVKVADTARALRDVNGWTLGSDMRTVTLLGTACDSARSGAPITVKVECAPVTLL